MTVRELLRPRAVRSVGRLEDAGVEQPVTQLPTEAGRRPLEMRVPQGSRRREGHPTMISGRGYQSMARLGRPPVGQRARGDLVEQKSRWLMSTRLAFEPP